MKSYCLIIMKPDALERELVEEIIQRFKKNGFAIEMLGYKVVTESLILKHYAHVVKKLGEPFEKMAIKSFVGKGMLPIILSQKGDDAIANARLLIGATDPSTASAGTIRGDYGSDSMEMANQEERCCNNLIHASDAQESFLEELDLWFSPETYKILMIK